MRHIIIVILAAATLLPAAASPAQGTTGEADLLGTAWLAEDIDSRGVIDRARSTMEFAKLGQVTGLAACNRYFGSVSLNGNTIAFGNLASTRKMCSKSLMDQEQRFMAALSKASRLDLTHEGQILLIYANGTKPTLRFTRIPQN